MVHGCRRFPDAFFERRQLLTDGRLFLEPLSTTVFLWSVGRRHRLVCCAAWLCVVLRGTATALLMLLWSVDRSRTALCRGRRSTHHHLLLLLLLCHRQCCDTRLDEMSQTASVHYQRPTPLIRKNNCRVATDVNSIFWVALWPHVALRTCLARLPHVALQPSLAVQPRETLWPHVALWSSLAMALQPGVALWS